MLGNSEYTDMKILVMLGLGFIFVIAYTLWMVYLVVYPDMYIN
jgi:uncharacterized membrane protein